MVLPEFRYRVSQQLLGGGFLNARFNTLNLAFKQSSQSWFPYLAFSITQSGILYPEMLQLNIGQLKISVGSSEKNNDIYVLANEDDNHVENDVTITNKCTKQRRRYKEK